MRTRLANLARHLFWRSWLPLTVLALGIIGWQASDTLLSDGQLVNNIRPGPTISLANGRQLGQTFVAARAGLERVDVLMFGYHRRNTQPVTFHLRPAAAAQDVFSATFNADEVWGWRWMSFRFPALPDSAGQTYYFFFESPTSTPEDALTLGGVEGDLYAPGTALINGQPARADAAFRTYYADLGLSDVWRALSARLVEGKPWLWGSLPFYVGLGVVYLLLVVGTGWYLIRTG